MYKIDYDHDTKEAVLRKKLNESWWKKSAWIDISRSIQPTLPAAEMWGSKEAKLDAERGKTSTVYYDSDGRPESYF